MQSHLFFGKVQHSGKLHGFKNMFCIMKSTAAVRLYQLLPMSYLSNTKRTENRRMWLWPMRVAKEKKSCTAFFFFFFAGIVSSMISTWGCLWSWAARQKLRELFSTYSLLSKLAFGKSFRIKKTVRVKQGYLSQPNFTVLTHSMPFTCPGLTEWCISALYIDPWHHIMFNMHREQQNLLTLTY